MVVMAGFQLGTTVVRVFGASGQQFVGGRRMTPLSAVEKE
jgi:hypothetical protein